MYNDYFGFRENPFSISPDPRYLYLSEMHQDGLAHLNYGLSSEGCIILLTGNIGTGKTTLGMQFIYNGIVKDNEPGLIITFEEFPQQYYYDAASFGWDFVELEKKGITCIHYAEGSNHLGFIAIADTLRKESFCRVSS